LIGHAEAINYQEFVRVGSMREVRDGGRPRFEGKDYIIQDADIISSRFNV